jgi:hypothetical protein
MLGRRELLGAVGVAAVALTAARTLGGLGTGRKPGRGAPGDGRSSGGSVEAELSKAGVHPKACFGACEVQSVETTRGGAAVVRLADSARGSFEVLLLTHDPRTPGIARAGSLSVFMKNKGDGATATVEEHGLAAMALARHLGRREAAGTRLPVLPTLSERSKTAGSAAA